jgi:hypothetical protein
MNGIVYTVNLDSSDVVGAGVLAESILIFLAYKRSLAAVKWQLRYSPKSRQFQRALAYEKQCISRLSRV